MHLKKYAILSVLLLILPLAYLLWSYYQVEEDSHNRERRRVYPRVEFGRTQEIGYIWDMRVSRRILEKKKEIIWWVKIPLTDKIYSCTWEWGFTGFSKDEGVVLIHMPGGFDKDTVDWHGYIIGLHGEHKGKSASVWALDVEDLLMSVD